MNGRSRIAARVTLSVAAVAALSGGCAALDQFQHAATLTFRVDTLECGQAKAAGTVCQFFAYYGNVSKKPIQVDPTSTKVVDRKGNVLQPVPAQGSGDSFLLKPGLQHAISWSVTVPAKATPAKVSWHGTSVPVLLDVAPLPSASAVPSVSSAPSTAPVPSTTPSAAPSALASTAAATTAAVTTTEQPTTTKPKPTTTKPKPTTTKPTVKPTTAKPTTQPPTTTPPPPIHTTTNPPVIHNTTPPTTNPTNPGGGSGGIG